MGNDTENTIWLTPLVQDLDFAVQFRSDHVHVELAKTFKITSETQNEFWEVVARSCDKHDSRRVLVEGYLPSGERDAGEIIDAGQRTSAVPNLWLAFSLADFEPTPNSELFEVIAAARGVRVRFFQDSERALRWLINNAPA